MIKSIKWKIFFGFLTLTFMLFVAGAISIYQFYTLTRKVNLILDNNYKTAEAAIVMLEAVEREDSGILMLLNGNLEEGREMINEGDTRFQTAYNMAINIMRDNPDVQYVLAVKEQYDSFRSFWIEPIAGTSKQQNISWYSNEVYPHFIGVKTSIKALMAENQSDIYNEASTLRDEAKRAIMPGIVAILSALTITILFTYFINKFFVKPLIVLTKKVENYKISDGPIDANIIPEDELKRLESAIQDLVYRLRRK